MYFTHTLYLFISEICSIVWRNKMFLPIRQSCKAYHVCADLCLLLLGQDRIKWMFKKMHSVQCIFSENGPDWLEQDHTEQQQRLKER